MSTELAEFLPAYLAEVEELLASANRQILRIEIALREGSRPSREARELFRVLHTIKGLSAMIDIEPVVAIAHKMETVLRIADRRGGALVPGMIDPLLRGLRAIEQRMHALSLGRAVEPAPRALLERIDALEAAFLETPLAAAAPAPRAALALPEDVAAKLSAQDAEQLVQGVLGGRRAVVARFTPSPTQTSTGRTITSVRVALGEIAEITKVLPIGVPADERAPGGLVFAILLLTLAQDDALAALIGADVAAIATIAAPVAEAAPYDDEELFEPGATDDERAVRPGFVRVPISRLDDALEALSSVIVGRARFALAVDALEASGADVRSLKTILGEAKRELRDLRASVLRLRMVPMRETLERLSLVVRSLEISTGRRVRLELDAGDAEIDKAVGERLFPAVVHLVRNAVDHAIEPEAERLALGKGATGELTIACRARASDLELVVSDDGRGIDRDALSARARTPITSDAAMLEVLCRPGLSTRDAVTTTSGRGMGMDIVRRIVVAELGGTLGMTTAPNVGTTFTLRVPLSLSITDALLFECATQRFAVPVRAVEEIVELDEARIVSPPRGTKRADGEDVRLIERRGAVIPLVLLGVRLRLAHSIAARRALVVRNDDTAMAFGIDRLLGHQEIVIRPVTDALVDRPGIAGTTDLGDGRPTLVLDLHRLGENRQELPA